jgi:2-polyprenyl-3-methyl-5-hydroxy-6-metoxy-1,4-benzoquinol methylase
MQMSTMLQKAEAFSQVLDDTKGRIATNDFAFYPYRSMGNVGLIDRLLQGSTIDIAQLVGGLPIADVGGADGDIAFFLESLGYQVKLFDHAPTNYNHLQGAQAVKAALQSSVEIIDVDLDSYFDLSVYRFGLTFFLGILYHLKNPYYVLNTFARISSHMLLSTRVTRFTPDHEFDISPYQLAYFLTPHELNNDSTNYWIFTSKALEVLLMRCGWEIVRLITVGDTQNSDPTTMEHDERAFVLVRSRIAPR